MSLSLPEFAVRDVIERAIAIMFDDEALVTDMLASLSEADQDMFRTAFDAREGKVRMGWALSPPEDWMVTVVMTGTQPVPTIGNVASDLIEDELAVRTLTDDIPATEPAVVAFVEGLPAVAPGDVVARGLLRIDDEEATYHLASGVCTLVARGVNHTTATAHDAGAEVLFLQRSRRIGYPEHVMIRVDVIGSNPPFLMILARILQAFLMHARDFFDEQGYTLETVTAGDLAPRSEVVAHLFARTLTLKVLTALSLPDIVPVITKATFTPTITPLEESNHHATL